MTILWTALSIVVGTVIAVCSIIGIQFGVIYFLLNAKINPLEKRIEGLEAGQANLEKGQANLEKGQKDIFKLLGKVLDVKKELEG